MNAEIEELIMGELHEMIKVLKRQNAVQAARIVTLSNDLKLAQEREGTWDRTIAQQAARIVEAEEENKKLRDAVMFYATRYHDENHTTEGLTRCASPVCIEAQVLLSPKGGSK